MIGGAPIRRALQRLARRADQPASMAAVPAPLVLELVEMTGGDPELASMAERIREEKSIQDSRARYGYLLFISTFR